MKKIVTVLAVAMGLILAGNSTKAQTAKIGTISLAELIPNMPEYKKADTSMNEFQNALQQQYQDMVNEYQEQSTLLTSKDTVKYTSAQLELKRKGVGDLLVKLQSWQQTAEQMRNQKNQELLGPIQKKALDAINAVAKENGYAWVISKDQLLVSPPADDILPLVKKKLGLK
ncbi:MAG TPA: OmpH family outer membrane protein [Puia sp.]|jgi:outer membrane protein|nr:OmpH family outer membrane protein [Puia sp.]